MTNQLTPLDLATFRKLHSLVACSGCLQIQFADLEYLELSHAVLYILGSSSQSLNRRPNDGQIANTDSLTLGF